MKKATIILLTLVWAGAAVAQDAKDTQRAIPKDMVITLERTVCYGTCPDYKVTITADGNVTFEGREFVKTKGTAKAHIGVEKLRQLIAEFEKSNYFALRDRYDDSSDGCPSLSTDMPSANTSIQINGRKKAVSHYLGCWEEGGVFKVYPKKLVILENQIDEIVGTKRWIK